MGCILSRHHESLTVWRLRHPTFDQEGLVVYNGNKRFAQLRELLDDDLSISYLNISDRDKSNHSVILCWLDIHDYRMIQDEAERLQMAADMMEYYFGGASTEGAIHTDFNGEHGIVSVISRYLATGQAPPDVFDKLQRACFLHLLRFSFPRLVRSEYYDLYRQEWRRTYNQVSVDDFEYLGLVGAGGYGRVALVRKKSTGVEYAMKVMQKSSLRSQDASLHRDFSRLERNVFALARCPFIVGLEYALQTEDYAILVLELMRGGDLEGLIDSSALGRLGEDIVAVYTAQAALALAYLHRRHLMYRDLKPANMLLDDRGHVRLADMGLVRDMQHKELELEAGLPAADSSVLTIGYTKDFDLATGANHSTYTKSSNSNYHNPPPPLRQCRLTIPPPHYRRTLQQQQQHQQQQQQ